MQEEDVFEDGDEGDDEAESEEKEVIEYHEPVSMLREKEQEFEQLEEVL